MADQFGFQPGFDPGFFVGTHPEIGPDLRKASDNLVQLTERAAESVRNPLVDAASTATALTQKIDNQLLSDFNKVDTVASKLTNKVEQNLANDFANLGEMVPRNFGERIGAIEPWRGGVAPAGADFVPPPVMPPPPQPPMMPPPVVGKPWIPPAPLPPPAPIGGVPPPPPLPLPPPAMPPAMQPAMPPAVPPAMPPADPIVPIAGGPVAVPPGPIGGGGMLGPGGAIVANPQLGQGGPAGWIEGGLQCYGDGVYGRYYFEPEGPASGNQSVFAPSAIPSGFKCVTGLANLQPDNNQQGDCVPMPAGMQTGQGVTDPANPASGVQYIINDPITGKPYCQPPQQPPQVSPKPTECKPCFEDATDIKLDVNFGSGQCKIDAYMLTDQSVPAFATAFTAWLDSFAGHIINQPTADLVEKQDNIIGKGIAVLVKGLLSPLEMLGNGVKMAGELAAPLGGCTDLMFTSSATVLIGVGVLDKYIGGPWDYLSTPAQYTMRSKCPVIFPSVDGAKAAYLGNTIDIDVLKNWVAINGHCWEPFERVLQTEYSKPIPDQLLQMVRRKVINDGDYNEGMRKLGYVKQEIIDQIRKIGEYAPPPQDIVRFMVRDADDETLVREFKLDDHFEDKYREQLKEWSKWSGVSDTYMKYLWRAHWDIPSPTQLFEMYHRLSRLPPTDPNYVSIENVRRALEQADIAPYWVDKYLAISHSPLTRVDVRRAFNIGVLDRSQVKSAYMDIGYTDFNAEVLTKFTEKEKLKAGYSHPATKRYLVGTASEIEMQAELIDNGYSPDQITQITERTRKLFRWKHAGNCVKWVKKRFMIGEHDADKARSVLIGFGLDGNQADVIIEGWKCELAARGKEFTAAQLSRLFENGLINPVEFVRRLERLGFRNDDAIKILTQQQLKQQRIQQKMTEQQQRQLEQQLAAQAREQAKLAAKAERDARSQQQQQASNAAATARRDAALVRAARDYSVQEGIEIDEANRIVQDCYKRVRKEYGLSVDESIQSVVIAIEKRPKGDTLDICTRVFQVADSIVEASVNTSG